ncbi:6851_t:CDS:2 [Racocetra fulgida]|uniref:6851_t:CDS:1 n=1 Tax=Racocetra fulgida TaxID=60492 RepID=A0A9N9AFG6_9GLOM|nr:6851_t:CDS:2 [Racocetra fulgida]
MASMFCAISFVKEISTPNKFTSGTAIYRAGDDEFVEYKFKAFRSEHTPLIEEIWKKTIALIVGRFAFENNQLNVTINQYIPLNVCSLGDDPTIYDLPIAPAFGFFTAPIQDPAVTESGQDIFRLKREVYNGVTGNQSTLSILCKYPLHSRHTNVADATTRRPIFSVGGELVPLAKSAFILCETIEWNYPIASPNAHSTYENNNHLNYNNKRKRQVERIAEKFHSHSSTSNNTYKNISQRHPRQNNSKPTTPSLNSENLRFNNLQTTLEQVRGT